MELSTAALVTDVSVKIVMVSKGFIKVFGIVSGIIAFIVDLVAFLQLFGIELIIAPSTRITILGPQAVNLRLPFNIDFRTMANIEVWTFVVWLYLAIAAGILSSMAYEESVAFECFSTLFCAFVAMLLGIWLQGVVHVPVDIYIFLVPTLAFIGLTWAANWGSLISTRILWIAVPPAILWFNAGYDWPFFWILVVTAVSFLTGTSIGYSLATRLSEWVPI